MDGGKGVPGGFVVARDGTELFEFAEEILDQMALFVEFAIEFTRRQAVWSGRMTADLPAAASGSRTRLSAFCDQQVGGHMRQQRISPGQVVRLSRGQQQAQRIAERVNQRMDLAAQTAAAAAKCLVLSFF